MPLELDGGLLVLLLLLGVDSGDRVVVLFLEPAHLGVFLGAFASLEQGDFVRSLGLHLGMGFIFSELVLEGLEVVADHIDVELLIDALLLALNSAGLVDDLLLVLLDIVDHLASANALPLLLLAEVVQAFVLR